MALSDGFGWGAPLQIRVLNFFYFLYALSLENESVQSGRARIASIASCGLKPARYVEVVAKDE